MSNYVQSTNFATKDALSSGDPLKIVKGTEINTEFSNIATAVATKADLLSPTFTGTPAGPTATPGTNTTQLATTAFVQAVKESLHPVGSIYINATNSTNPGTLLGFGTWTAFGAGRVPVGFNAADPLFDTAEETGGSKNAIVAGHTHTFSGFTNTKSLTGDFTTSKPADAFGSIISVGSAGLPNGANGSESTAVRYVLDVSHDHEFSGTTNTTGDSGTNANLQPYITVYMFKRTA